MRVVMFSALFLSGSAFAGGPMLDISGACPGVLDVQVMGVSPGATVGVLRGAGPGSDVIPAGPCAGLPSGLSGLGFVTTVRDADRDGMISVSPSIGGPLCGLSVQMLDTSTCTLSNLDTLGELGGDCVPSGARAPFDTPSDDTVSGCYDGNFCDHDEYAFGSGTAKIFANYGESASCAGGATCVGNVGITTYASEGNCQGSWDVLCDGAWVGTIDTVGRTCTGSAMSDGCAVSFAARRCSEITFEAVPASADEPTGCCLWDAPPDAAISSFSAW